MSDFGETLPWKDKFDKEASSADCFLNIAVPLELLMLFGRRISNNTHTRNQRRSTKTLKHLISLLHLSCFMFCFFYDERTLSFASE